MYPSFPEEKYSFKMSYPLTMLKKCKQFALVADDVLENFVYSTFDKRMGASESG